MKELALILQVLSYIPAFQVTNVVPPQAHVSGQGTLLIAACDPGAVVVAQPGNLMATADDQGVARIKAPAQGQNDAVYRLDINGEETAFNGTLSENQTLSAVCP